MSSMLDDAPKVGRYRHLAAVVPAVYRRKLLILLEVAMDLGSVSKRLRLRASDDMENLGLGIQH